MLTLPKHELALIVEKATAADYRAQCGELLGRGSTRTVYAHRTRPDLVIKAESHDNDYVCPTTGKPRTPQNVVEWRNWQHLRQYPECRKWFAPCVEISPCGAYLLQKRAEPLREADIPPMLPYFLDRLDARQDNWGVIDGQVVVCDYGRPESGFDKMMEWYINRVLVPAEPYDQRYINMTHPNKYYNDPDPDDLPVLEHRQLRRIAEAVLNEHAWLVFDAGSRGAKSTNYVSREAATAPDAHWKIQDRFKQNGDWNDHKPWVKSVGGTFPCGVCGKTARLGFEVKGRNHCVRCYEDDESLHDDGEGYGRGCMDCGGTAKLMFFVEKPTFLKFYPRTKANPEGGIVCLPCFEDRAGGVADYYNELKLHLWPATDHRDLKLLVP